MKNPKEEAYEQVVINAEQLGAQPFEPNAMGNALMAELKARYDELPDSTRRLLMGCVASLKKHHADAVISERRALEMVQRLRDRGGKIP